MNHPTLEIIQDVLEAQRSCHQHILGLPSQAIKLHKKSKRHILGLPSQASELHKKS
jgi:hypothetical protein